MRESEALLFLNLTAFAAEPDRDVTPSPDGNYIATIDHQGCLRVVDKSNNQERVYKRKIASFHWHPKSNRIVFVEKETNKISTIYPDSSFVTPITDCQSGDRAEWSESGYHIFVGNETKGKILESSGSKEVAIADYNSWKELLRPSDDEQ